MHEPKGKDNLMELVYPVVYVFIHIEITQGQREVKRVLGGAGKEEELTTITS